MNNDAAIKLFLTSPAALFILMLFASLGQGIKQLSVIKQTGTPMSFGKYLSYWPETVSMLVANIIAFAVLIAMDQLNIAAAIGVGYGTNSLVDLLPGKRSMILKATPDDPVKIVARNLDPKTAVTSGDLNVKEPSDSVPTATDQPKP